MLKKKKREYLLKNKKKSSHCLNKWPQVTTLKVTDNNYLTVYALFFKDYTVIGPALASLVKS